MVYVTYLCSTVVYKFLFVSGSYFTINIVHTLLHSNQLGYVHFSTAHVTCLLLLYMVIRNKYCFDVYKQYTSIIIAFYTTLLQTSRRSRFYILLKYILHENILHQRNYVRKYEYQPHPTLGSCNWTCTCAVVSPYPCSSFSAFKQKEHSSKADKLHQYLLTTVPTFLDLTILQTPSNENFQSYRSSDTTSQRQFLFPLTDSSSLQSQRSSRRRHHIDLFFERTASHRPHKMVYG